MNEVEEVVRCLKPLAERRHALPSADDVYWQARVRGILNEEQRRRRAALRPMRWFHLTIGVAMIVAAVVASVSPLVTTLGAIEDLLPLAVIGLAAVGAYLLGQAGPGRAAL